MDSGLLNELKERAKGVRRDIVGMLGLARSGCLSPSLSVVDILVWLYGAVLNVQPKKPWFEGRDRFVLSRTSAAPALYATLAERGFFCKDELWEYRRLGSLLQPFPEYRRTPGVDVSCGASGMGPGISLGLALALRTQGIGSRVLCLMGAEEASLGSVWEALGALEAVAPVRLTLVVNREIGGGDRPSEADEKAESTLTQRFESFGWPVVRADGHDMAKMNEALGALPEDEAGVLLLRTLWGKGIPSLEASAFRSEHLLDRQATERLLGELEVAAL